MSDVAAPALPFDILNPTRSPAASSAAARTPAAMRKIAEDFEASFLAAMLQPIFNNLSTEAPFGGGQGEAAFKSFMVDSMSRQTARAGGVGLADAVLRQMLQMQGLAPDGSPLVPPGQTPVPEETA